MGLFWMNNPPEIYTAAIGLYSLWLIIRVSTSLYGYLTEGAVQLMTQVAVWVVQALKCVVAGTLLFVVIPLLLGHLVDLFLLSPLRVPTDRTPIFYASTVSHTFLKKKKLYNIECHFLKVQWVYVHIHTHTHTHRNGPWVSCTQNVCVVPSGLPTLASSRR